MKPKTIIAIGGLPTSGKTSLGYALAQATGLHFIDIDEGPANCAPKQEPNPYQSEESRLRERVRMTVAYMVLHAAVRANLEQGFSTIISAAYPSHVSQDFLQKAVEIGDGNLKFILCKYNDAPEEIERRIKDRLTRGANGGCRSVSHYIDDRARYASIKLPHIIVCVEGGKDGLDKAIQQSLEYISKG